MAEIEEEVEAVENELNEMARDMAKFITYTVNIGFTPRYGSQREENLKSMFAIKEGDTLVSRFDKYPVTPDEVELFNRNPFSLTETPGNVHMYWNHYSFVQDRLTSTFKFGSEENNLELYAQSFFLHGEFKTVTCNATTGNTKWQSPKVTSTYWVGTPIASILSLLYSQMVTIYKVKDGVTQHEKRYVSIETAMTDMKKGETFYYCGSITGMTYFKGKYYPSFKIHFIMHGDINIDK